MNTISLKLVELAPLTYFVVTAALFTLHPSTIDNSIYEPWNGVGAHGWAVIIGLFSVSHAAALWWNGRSRVLSRIARAIALLGYLWVSLTFGMMFVVADIPWGAVLFWVLMPLLCGSLFLRIADEVKVLNMGV